MSTLYIITAPGSFAPCWWCHLYLQHDFYSKQTSMIISCHTNFVSIFKKNKYIFLYFVKKKKKIFYTTLKKNTYAVVVVVVSSSNSSVVVVVEVEVVEVSLYIYIYIL